MRVFISYRSCEPDISLAQEIFRALRNAGHRPFVSKESIEWGDDWSLEIDEQLEACECYVLLLSDEAAQSDAVLEEVETIHRRQPRPRVFVLRLRLQRRPSYDLRIRIRRFQSREWHSETDTAVVVNAILDRLGGPENTPEAGEPGWPSASEPMPTPTADLPGGQVSLASGLYQSRVELDGAARAEIERAPALLRIRGPRQSGKTSLLSRAVAHGRSLGFQCASLSLQLADARTRGDTERLLIWYCQNLGRELALSAKPPQSIGSCQEYFEDCVLGASPRPLLIALDEIDSLMVVPEVAGDFYGMLRAWHEKGRANSAWARLRLIVSYSTEAALYVPVYGGSPLENVGRTVTMRDFNRSEFRQFSDSYSRYGSAGSPEAVSILLEETEGHPYLASLGLFSVCIERLSHTDALSWARHGPVREHLLRLLRLVRREPGYVDAMASVCRDSHPVRIDEELGYKLEGAGLIRMTPEGAAVPRCRLYRRFFSDRLPNDNPAG